jgi:hypothetical protein
MLRFFVLSDDVDTKMEFLGYDNLREEDNIGGHLLDEQMCG